MTVAGLLEAMIGFFKGFDAAAVTAAAPIFVRKLQRYEGVELENAWIEVAASFKPTGMKPYPVPADFEEVLPRSAKMPKGHDGASLDLKGHGERQAALVADWRSAQGPSIAQAFGPRVLFWCESAVRDRADVLAWETETRGGVRLKQEDVDKVFASVVSRDRLAAYSGWPIGRLSAPQWEEQMEICRGHVLAGRFSADEVAIPIQPIPRKRPAPPPPVLEQEQFVQIGEAPDWVDEAVPDFAEVPE